MKKVLKECSLGIILVHTFPPPFENETKMIKKITTKTLPLFIKINEAVTLSGIGRTVLYRLLSEGKIKSAKIGKSRLINRASLIAFIEGNQ